MTTEINGFAVFGAIEEKWSSLSGADGPLGLPLSNETATFDGVGRFQNFTGGIISWHPETGAHVVWGAIGSRWLEVGREAFGYPITDEVTTIDGWGRFNHFRAIQLAGKPEASIFWTPETGAHEVYGAIREKWASLGWETGSLGYPVSSETATFDGVGRFQNFNGGIISWHPETGAHVVWGAIAERWLAIGREAYGYPITDEVTAPDGRGRFNHFRTLQLPGKPEPSIYWTPETGAHEIYGDIRKKWGEIGFERSFLGYPIAAEVDFPEGGRVGAFEHGEIYWWADTGPIELNDLVVNYSGIVCFKETRWDQFSDSDEPYVVVGTVAPTGSWATRTNVYDDVDTGESRPDRLEVYRGKPRGLALSVLVLEHDEEDPDKYKGAMQSAVSGAFAGITTLVALIPVVGPVISSVAGPLLGAVAPKIGEELNRVLDFGDDWIGQTNLAVSAKQMVVLAGKSPSSEFMGINFKLETVFLTGEGASYKVYFDFERV